MTRPYPYIVDPYVQVFATVQPVGLIAMLPAAIYPRLLHSVSITGPSLSRADLYMGTVTDQSRFDSTSRGDTNTADYPSARIIPAGVNVFVVWPNQTSGTASATFYVQRGN